VTAAQVAYLVILSVCVLASGFFSGSETALVGVPRERVVQLQEPHPRRASRIADLTDDPDRMLSTILVGNNFVNILGASVATVLFVDLLGEDWGPWVSTLTVTAVVLLVGEITPKILATRYPERFSLAVAPTIWRLSVILRPISRFFLILARGLFRLFGVHPNGGPSPITEEDIRAMAVLGERTGDIEAAEREIIHSLFHLADRPAREVMTPRPDIYSLQDPAGLEAVRSAVAASGHSRFPVIGEDLDDLRGILHVKDVLRMSREPSADDIRRLVREPYYVPESRSLLRLLHDMRSNRRAIAFVLDEHGGVEGIVTIKDIVSELVGELQDEYDPGSPSLVAVRPGEWLADGRMPVEEVAEALGAELPAGPYSTLAGLILDLAGCIPEEGATVSAAGHRFTVMRMDRRRIDRIRIDAAAT
jgi:putative hemolysin